VLDKISYVVLRSACVRRITGRSATTFCTPVSRATSWLVWLRQSFRNSCRCVGHCIWNSSASATACNEHGSCCCCMLLWNSKRKQGHHSLHRAAGAIHSHMHSAAIVKENRPVLLHAALTNLLRHVRHLPAAPTGHAAPQSPCSRLARHRLAHHQPAVFGSMLSCLSCYEPQPHYSAEQDDIELQGT
jgi:hypothetical protein